MSTRKPHGHLLFTVVGNFISEVSDRMGIEPELRDIVYPRIIEILRKIELHHCSKGSPRISLGHYRLCSRRKLSTYFVGKYLAIVKSGRSFFDF